MLTNHGPSLIEINKTSTLLSFPATQPIDRHNFSYTLSKIDIIYLGFS